MEANAVNRDSCPFEDLTGHLQKALLAAAGSRTDSAGNSPAHHGQVHQLGTGRHRPLLPRQRPPQEQKRGKLAGQGYALTIVLLVVAAWAIAFVAGIYETILPEPGSLRSENARAGVKACIPPNFPALDLRA